MGICKMCREEKVLCESHFMPGCLYDHVTDGRVSSVRIGDGMVMPTDRQVKDRLLCGDCEQRLCKSEAWVCPKLVWPDRRFELYNLVAAERHFEDSSGNGTLYYVKNGNVSVHDITHFALGIFWKAAVHPWKGGKDTPFIELPEHDQIRRWLLGESAFPVSMSLMLTVSKPDRAQLTFNPPGDLSSERDLRRYHFHALGTSFALSVGQELPVMTRMSCFYWSPDHPVLVSDRVTTALELRQAQEFGEARKTQAYERYKAKRAKST